MANALDNWVAEVTQNYPVPTLPRQGERLPILRALPGGDVVVRHNERELLLRHGHYKAVRKTTDIELFDWL